MPLIKSLGPDFPQAPGDVLDYSFDWLAGGWLVAGDIITASTWTIQATQGTPTLPNITSPPQTFGPAGTTCWVSGGADGFDYVLSNQITTSSGRKRTRSILIRVRSVQ